jgi:hypothetical protein
VAQAAQGRGIIIINIIIIIIIIIIILVRGGARVAQTAQGRDVS